MSKFKLILVTVLMTVLLMPLAAQGKISGLVFADYYYMLSNHNPGIEGMNGVWFRRIYITYDRKLTSMFKIRVRFEANSSGDFATKEKIIPYVKDLYLQWSKNGHSIILGISPTPTFKQFEKFWGYRSVEKTPLDLYKMASSRDTGLAFKGRLAKRKIYYHLMFANGEGNQSEFNKQKKVLGAVGFYASKNLYIEFYGDYEKGPVSGTDIYTTQGFVGASFKKFSAGILYATQTHQLGEEGNLKLRVASIFARVKIKDSITILGRFDRMMDPLPAGPSISYLPLAPSSPFNLFIAGIDYRVNKNFNIIPNLEFVSYDDIKENDTIAKITFLYMW